MHGAPRFQKDLLSAKSEKLDFNIWRNLDATTAVDFPVDERQTHQPKPGVVAIPLPLARANIWCVISTKDRATSTFQFIRVLSSGHGRQPRVVKL